MSSDQPVRTIAVTGAYGQVGRHVTEILLNRGCRVVAMDLPDPEIHTAAMLLASNAPSGRLISAFADLLDSTLVHQIIAEHAPEAIVHLAGMYSPPSYLNPRLSRRVNVEGTKNLLAAAHQLTKPPLIAFASSAAVYGSRNPHTHPERITAHTPLAPVDQYGEDKMLAEDAIVGSTLPYCILRLGGVLSPDSLGQLDGGYLLLMRATPGDNRLHTVDARDVGLAFANAVDRRDAVNGKILLIAGDESHLHTHREAEDDMMQALGLGRLGPAASLPGDPDDEGGWSFTGWFDTTESQELLDFQRHDWPATVEWAVHPLRRVRPVLRVLGPLLRPSIRRFYALQRRIEHRGRFADPWMLISRKYGPEVLAETATEGGKKATS